MLDVSCNLLRSVPPAIHALAGLSVLNISGNKEITDLPPQMGLLSRLWNLNASGCSLQEPLRSMLRGGRYKSADVVGYLKSVLQEARPYTNIKLMFVGLQGIGKTSLLECLRQESAIHHRRKPTDHWAKRMGNKTPRRGNLSTVGVDIGTWVYEKHRSTRGPVTFRTWDFGGQQEYYATHQYFLSRRSLYLVVWKATDGRNGLAGAIEWLRSIQARAPGSPVIMVATHYDQVANDNTDTPVKGLNDEGSNPGQAKSQEYSPSGDTSEINVNWGKELVAAISALRDETKNLREEISNLRIELGEIKTELSTCKSNVREISKSVAALDQRIGALENQQKPEGSNVGLELTITELKNEIDNRDQLLLSNELEISGITENEHESPLHIVKTIASKIGVDIQDQDVADVFRSGPRRLIADSSDNAAISVYNRYGLAGPAVQYLFE
ncbi:uncharacterized protein LOC114355710 [Ostrinia furnacalis]|uniref:uncharacterized protein LOC114355710 n=1 Tax=Ostrinia furnacalis TaxID=93504 RepID=UPI0010396EB4|nr:uncharacterized protein LOC114355710 [Ostrinia furnacalis]